MAPASDEHRKNGILGNHHVLHLDWYQHRPDYSNHLRTMSQFKHLDGMVALLSEIYEINERVMCGDLVSAKAAIDSTKMKKLLHHYHEALHEDGATNVSLQAYVAAGGWVGITYSYALDGFEVAGSQVPRRV